MRRRPIRGRVGQNTLWAQRVLTNFWPTRSVWPDYCLSGRRGAGQVVDGLAADGLRGEVGLHPRGDLRGVARAAAEAVRVGADEVVDLVIRDIPLELGERRRGVGAVEPADRHDRLAAGVVQ